MKRNKRIYRPKFNTGGNLGFNIGDLSTGATPVLAKGLDLALPGAGQLYSGINAVAGIGKSLRTNEDNLVGQYNKDGNYSGNLADRGLDALALHTSAVLNPLERFGAVQKASESGGNIFQSAASFALPGIAEDLAAKELARNKKRDQRDAVGKYESEKTKQDLADLSGYNTNGDYNISYYAKDGALVPIAAGAFEARGATHQQGGIDMGNVEIENKELVRLQPNGTMEIDSARLGTAKKNKELLEQKNKLTAQLESIKGLMEKEQKLNDLAKNEYSKNTVNRNLEKLGIQAKEIISQMQAIDAEIESNFQDQQQQNGNYGYPSDVEMGCGGKVKKYDEGGTIDEGPIKYLSPLSPLASNVPPSSIIQTEVNDTGKIIYDINDVYKKTGGKPNDKSTRYNIGYMAGSSNEALGMVNNMYLDGKYHNAYTPGKDPKDYKSYIKTGNNTNPHNMSYSDFYVDMLKAGFTDEELQQIIGGKWANPYKTPNELYKVKQLLLNPDGSYKSKEELLNSGVVENNKLGGKDWYTNNTFNQDNPEGEVNDWPIANSTTPVQADSTTQTLDINGNPIDIRAIGKLANRVVPYIDIVGNKILNDRLRDKEIPKPDALLAPNYNTDYNVNPQLAELSRATNDFNYNVGKNLSSPLAGAYQLAALKNKLSGTSNILDKEQQYELAANAQKSRETNQIVNANIQASNVRKQKVFEKEIQTDYVNPSKNLAKLEANLQDEITQNRKEDYDNQVLAAMQAAYPKQIIGSFVSMFNSTDPAVVEQGIKNLNDGDKVKAGFSQINSTDSGWNKFVKHAESFNLTGEFVTADDRVAVFKNGKFQSFKK